MRLNRRRLGGGVLIIAGIIALVTPFFLFQQTQQVAGPPPPGGGGHGGTKNDGGTTSRCTTNCPNPGPTDSQPPTTTLLATGPIKWSRNGIAYFYPTVTLTLHATDDQNLTSISLNDTGRLATFKAEGRSANATLTLSTTGIHALSYYSSDEAGNREPTHVAIVGLGRPDLSDIRSIITNSNIDNSGIKNALLAKVSVAESQLGASQIPSALNSLSNQLNALASKHGLDQSTVDQLEALIRTITP